MSSFDLTGKVALVTGGSRGLGRSIALGFAAAGASVVVVSRKQEACESVAREIEDSGGVAMSRPCHVGKWNDLDQLVDDVVQRFGRLDILVNNAGMSPLYDSPESVTEELYDKTFDVNLKGAFRLTALAATKMLENGGGSVINISSIGAERPARDIIMYAAAKAGLNAMTIAFADAFGPTVRVNGIAPGTFLTDISRTWDMEAFQRVAQTFPLQRGAEADEIVGTAIYLASAASSYTTGETISVDGGARWAANLRSD